MKWLGTWWKVDDGRRVVGDLVEDKAGLQTMKFQPTLFEKKNKKNG